MKTTLIVDGNWLMMSRLFAVDKMFLIDNPEVQKEQGTRQLKDMMARSINVILNRFGKNLNNIIIVSDGGSWRKQLPKPESMSSIKYKGNRVNKVEFDWDYIYKALNELTDTARDLGITAPHADGIEGDDWIWYWTRRLNQSGVNTIIWSSDNDLKQLIQLDNGAFTAWYNDRSGLFLPKELDDKVDDVDFFMHPERSNYALDELKKCCLEVNYIDSQEVVMSKIICGDSSDNIKPVLRLEGEKKTINVTERDWQAVKEDLNISDLKGFFESAGKILQKIVLIPKFRKFDGSKSILEDNFEYNKKLVWLNEEVIPESIIQRMAQEEYKEYDIYYIHSNYLILCGEESSVEEIFEGVKI